MLDHADSVGLVTCFRSLYAGRNGPGRRIHATSREDQHAGSGNLRIEIKQQSAQACIRGTCGTVRVAKVNRGIGKVESQDAYVLRIPRCDRNGTKTNAINGISPREWRAGGMAVLVYVGKSGNVSVTVRSNQPRRRVDWVGRQITGISEHEFCVQHRIGNTRDTRVCGTKMRVTHSGNDKPDDFWIDDVIGNAVAAERHCSTARSIRRGVRSGVGAMCHDAARVLVSFGPQASSTVRRDTPAEHLYNLVAMPARNRKAVRTLDLSEP